MNFFKQGRTAWRKQQLKDRATRASKERDAKQDARKRDKRCRFPLCGCQKLGLTLKSSGEVSHRKHKGMGGNPSGDRSTKKGLMLLCKHRHQDGRFSLHKGTVWADPLDEAKGYDGPVVWWLDLKLPVDKSEVYKLIVWEGEDDTFELARESAPGALRPLTPLQREVLKELAKMDE
jgi:hypothetical protein